MWETLVKPPRGRISARKFTVLLITLVVACFTYVVAMAPTTYAADAEWNEEGTGIVYNGRTYTNPQTVTDTGAIDLPEGSTYLTSIDRSVTPNRAFVIYFASGTSPPSASRATAVTFTLDGDNYTNRSATTAITVVPQSGATAEGTTSCATEDTPGLSWLICPLTNTLAKAMDFIYGIVSGYLEVRPLATTADQPMYRAWEYMRNIANVAFVIAFMVIIYSQVTSIGLDNYSIKKLLPRVIVAALLVNVSYWICAIAIDIFNVLGYSIQDLFISVRNSLVGAEGNSWDVISWESMASFVLSGGAVAGGIGIGAYLGITSLTVGVAGAGAASGLIFLLLPMLLSVLFVVLMTFLILAARQAIITILVVLAPLAFVAYLLPNTEEWFTKWRKALFTLLLVFPAFSLVFAGAQLAAALIIQNATDLNMILLAMGVQVAPLAITPLLLKLGGGILNRFAGIVNNPTKGVFDRGKNWARERSAQHAAAGHAKLAERTKELKAAGGGNRLQRTRINPKNMTYAREYRRREREGMKSANEAMTSGLFEGTAAGTNIYTRNRDATLEKETGETANLRQYNTSMATGGDTRSVYRRKLHEQAHENKGVGSIYENRLNSEAEQGLREHVIGSQALQNQISRTTDHTNRAKQAEDLVQDRANEAWEKSTLTDKTVYTRNFERQGVARQIKSAQEEWDAILTEASAGHAKDYERKFGAPTQQVNAILDNVAVAETKIVAEGKRKAEAEADKQNQINDAFLKNTTQIAGMNIRDYAGGIRDGGAESVLAQSVAKFRSEYGRQMGERAELVKHFNLSGSDRQKLALGESDVTVTRDGVTHKFDKTDFYLREAMVDTQLKAGSFDEIEKIIAESVEDGATHEYRTTIAQAIVDNKLTSKALYYGSKTIDDVAQGKVNLDDAAAYHIVSGKVKAELLSGQGASAIKRLFEVANNTSRIPGYAQWTDEKKNTFTNYVEALPGMAAAILDDPLLNRNTDQASREVLEQYRTPPTNP